MSSIGSSISLLVTGIAIGMGIMASYPQILKDFERPLREIYPMTTVSKATMPTASSLENGQNLATQETQEAESSEDVDKVWNDSPLYPCTFEFLQDYFYDVPIDGYHIICLSEDKDGDNESLALKLYERGTADNEYTYQLESNWNELRNTLQYELGLTSAEEDNYGDFQPWAIFSPLGRRLVDGNSDASAMEILLENGVGLVMLGGQWLWPGVREGFERANVPIYSVMPIGLEEDPQSNRTVTIRTLSLSPLVVSIEGFLSDEECSHVRGKAEPSMKYSDVVLMDKDAGRPASDFRTSQSTFLASDDDPILRDIDNRVASLTRIPRNHQEHVQVLRYGYSEKYDHHTDYFDPDLYQNDRATLQTIRNGNRNRIATVFWYLTTVEKGGETAFPKAFGAQPYDMRDCTVGLRVKPEQGRVIIFYSLLMTGDTDPNSLHGACPVKEGIKWAANKWVSVYSDSAL